MYSEWAAGQISKMKGILNSARDGHTEAVQKRIDSVAQLGSVIDVTKNLFEVSKVHHLGSIWDTCCNANLQLRRQHSWKHKLLSLSNGPLWLQKQSKSLIHGCDTRVR